MRRASLVSAEFAVHYVHAKVFDSFCSPAFPRARYGRWAGAHRATSPRSQTQRFAYGTPAASAVPGRGYGRF
eukprot:3546934-Lingulodinium_polyedra.AAC.1